MKDSIMEISVIKKLFQIVDDGGCYTKEYNKALERVIEREEMLFDEIKENPKAESALTKFRESLEALNSSVTYFYFEQAFKMGFNLGCEISEDIKKVLE